MAKYKVVFFEQRFLIYNVEADSKRVAITEAYSDRHFPDQVELSSIELESVEESVEEDDAG